VLAQTLRHGAREGRKIALSPLVTDAPVTHDRRGRASR
jgi:hypothetical protein